MWSSITSSGLPKVLEMIFSPKSKSTKSLVSLIYASSHSSLVSLDSKVGEADLGEV